jgi:prophage tail gpP-like protein
VSAIVDFPSHEIRVVVAGRQIDDWESYELHSSMTEPDSHFAVRMPFTRAVWDLCRPDAPIKALIDDVVVLNGFVDERLVPENDEVVEIVGRNRAGRLVQESAPSLEFNNLGMFELIKKVAAPWFTTVTFSNARNRRVLRGRGKKARAAGEPVILTTRKKIGTRIEPGQSRWQVIEDLCAQAGYLAWPSGDGTELIVGEPNYDQEVQFKFFMPEAGSSRAGESTVKGIGVRESVADRYSRIIVVGSGTGTDANYGAAVASRYGEAKNNPVTTDGEGLDFTAPKRLIAVRSVASTEEANELAEREMARRDVRKQMLTVVAPGHGQLIAGVYTTIFAPDTLAAVEDERTGIKGTFLITECVYRGHRDSGEETTMELVPKGSELIS